MKKYLIIGNSAAGVSAANEIRKNDKSSDITIISDEKGNAYSRCLLSYYISGDIDRKSLIFKDDDFYKKNKINLLDGKQVKKIHKSSKEIELKNKEKLSYDKLLIATGASAKKISTEKENNNSIFTLRTIDDAENILKNIPGIKSAAILGSGLIGLKTAYALFKKGKKINLIARSNRILSQMIDYDSARFLIENIKDKINFFDGVDVKEFIYEKNILKGLILSDDNKIDCEMAIIAKGVKPNTELANDTGLEADNGILVNEYLKTSCDDIYAAGDVAETIDLLTGKRGIKALWTTAIEQGKIAGKNMTGEKIIYNGSLLMNSVECFGIPCISSGYSSKESQEIFEYKSREPYNLRRVFISDNKINGYITIGDIKFSGILNNLLANKRDVSGIKNKFNTSKLSRSDLLECIDKEEITTLMEKK